MGRFVLFPRASDPPPAIRFVRNVRMELIFKVIKLEAAPPIESLARADGREVWNGRKCAA
jgi:hypothetical protein